MFRTLALLRLVGAAGQTASAAGMFLVRINKLACAAGV